MGSFLDLLCCSGGSYEEASPSNTSKYQSTNTNSTNKAKQPVKDKTTEVNKALHSRSTNKTNQPTKPKMTTINRDLQPSLKAQSSSGVSQPDKTNVTVYEATDSTVDTANDVHENNGSISVDKYGQEQSSYDSEEVGDEDDEYDQIPLRSNEDDFFDLTKLQPGQAHASSGWLLDASPPHLANRKCLILDLDETLVHSSFKYLRHADFVIPVDIDNQLHNVYVIKRPGVDEFMKRVGEIYEVVVFTASVARYGDPLLDALDIHKSVHHRLFRDSCYNYQGNYIKNLSQIGRPLQNLIILDNSPASYIFHPQHAIPISSWFSDAHDNELLDIIPFLEDLAKENVEDIGLVLDINL